MAAGLMPDDIDDQGLFTDVLAVLNTDNNYGYDQLGQLVSDNAEELEEIVWRVDGKIKAIFRDNSSLKKELLFTYDAMGNRVAKRVYSSTGSLEKTTYYIRDAQGNVMSVYERPTVGATVSLIQTELHIYGSSRLGMINPTEENEMIAASDPEDIGIFSYKRGLKQYELSNHLGNVLSVITDQKIVEAPVTGTLIEFYYAEVISYSDYYPFGSAMSERSWQGDYRYGFNGKERDNSTASDSYDFGARIMDTRLGRWLSGDPAEGLFPNESPYMYAGCNPIYYVDPNGKWKIKWRDNNDHTNGIVFEAEAGDNLQVLADQMGIPYQQLLDENFGGKDFTLNAPLDGGEWLRQEDLPGVETFQNVNSYLKDKSGNQEDENCATFCLFAVEGEQDGWTDPGEMDKTLEAGYKNLKKESDAQIGDIVTLVMSYPEFEHFMWLEAKVQGVTKEEFKQHYEEKTKNSGAHYLIVLLKTKDGNGIQNTIQKSGTTPVIIGGYPNQLKSQDSESGEDMFIPSPVNNDKGSPVYRKTETTEPK